MSAVPTRGNRTDRSIAVLTYLEKQTRPRNVREIINAVGGDVNCTLMYGTLTTLQRQGRLLVKKIAGNNMFRIAPGAMINRVTGVRIDQATTPAQEAKRARRELRQLITNNKVVVKEKPKSTGRAKPTKAPPRQAPPPSPSAKAQHAAALVTKATNTQRLTVANAHGGAYLAVKQLASAQINADIAAFEAAGGKVQRLDMHECSRPLNHDYRNPGVAAAALRGGQANKKKHTSPSRVVDDGEDE